MSKQFSIGVSGRGVHHGMFITEACNRWKGVSLYDDGAKATAFRKAEVKLGSKGYLDKAGTDHAKRIAENLAAPKNRDVAVDFKVVGGKPVVEISGPHFRKFQMQLNEKTSFDKIKQQVMKIIGAVEAVMVSPKTSKAMA